MQLKTKFGLGLLVLGLVIFVAWNWWMKTRNFVPVDVPASLVAGEIVTSEFKLNFDGLYLIEIEAAKTVPLDRLHCLMGVEADPLVCQDIPPAIGATWTLSSQGQVVGRGSSADLHSAPVRSDGVARVIGEFQGTVGQEYKLQVAVTADSARLAEAHPRLKVNVANIARTDLQAANVLVFSTTFIFLLFGVILLSIAYFAKHGADGAQTPRSQ